MRCARIRSLCDQYRVWTKTSPPELGIDCVRLHGLESNVKQVKDGLLNLVKEWIEEEDRQLIRPCKVTLYIT